MAGQVPHELFFATSFSGHVNYDTGFAHDDFRERIEQVLTALRDVSKLAVYCAVEAEGWQIGQQTPGVSMATNFDNIESRPLFLALVDKVGSDGRGVEIEHAHNSGSRVFLATGPNEELSWVMKEIVAMGRAEHIQYTEPEELAMKLNEKIAQ